MALVGTALMVVLLTPGTFFSSRRENSISKRKVEPTPGPSTHPDGSHCSRWHGSPLRLHRYCPGSGRYITTLFKLSSVLIIIWDWLFLGEEKIQQRLLGTSVMLLLGGILVALF